MKYKENETLKEATTIEVSVKETPVDTPTIDKKTLYSSIRKVINLRIKILEDSLADLKNLLVQLEDLHNERDN